MVAIFSTGHDDSGWEMPLVVHDVRDERRLSRTALPYEYTHLVVANL